MEHARIYYFKNGGEEEYFIGSADLMKRNLESRVEVSAPVEKAELRALLRQHLDAQLQDTRSAWEMQSDGSYRQLRPGPEGDGRGAQQVLTDLATQRWQDHMQNSARSSVSPHGYNIVDVCAAALVCTFRPS